ncbi:hypothetical protein D3C87_1857430 [compost metagenome]
MHTTFQLKNDWIIGAGSSRAAKKQHDTAPSATAPAPSAQPMWIHSMPMVKIDSATVTVENSSRPWS